MMDTMQLLNQALGILDSIILLGIFIVLLFKKRSQKTGEEFAITFNSLSSVLTSYKQHVLDPKLKILRKEHDLDPKSKSNSIKVYNKEKEELIRNAANEIFAKYINRKTLKNLEEFYTREGLILFIITYFRG
jgi:hypothetical protein